MNNTYGYFRGTKGKDGDHIDVFLGPDLESPQVYVVDQVNQDGSFDEHKVMWGFSSKEEAWDAYLSNYSPEWKGLGSITGVPREGFDEWMSVKTKKQKSFSEYKIAKNKKENNPENKVLSESEFITQTINKPFLTREDQSIGREEWEESDEGIKAFNKAADYYPNYIESLSNNGSLRETPKYFSCYDLSEIDIVLITYDHNGHLEIDTMKISKET